jgi:hypothetical protein
LYALCSWKCLHPGREGEKDWNIQVLNSETAYKRLFLAAALYNLGLGSVFLFFYSGIAAVIAMPAELREADVFSQMAILLAMAFGVGYYMVSRDLYGHRGIVIMGIIGKLAVFLLFLYHLIFSGLPAPFFLIGVGDLLFALLFWKFLAFIGGVPESKPA